MSALLGAEPPLGRDALLDHVRLLIFDADGTLRRTTVSGRPCPHAPDEWELLPGVRDTLATVDWTARGIRLGIASNQDHVGYGLLAGMMAERLLRDALDAATDGRVRDPLIRFCPHRLDVACACRKPAPGLLLALLHAARVQREETLFVGDATVDAEAARRAGVRFHWAHEVFGRPLTPPPSVTGDPRRY
ncbi:MAG TPA: HAD-IIIA family hydrolase [Gemmatimonadaceae bacterium]|nr:HAD-IIIA family hydrolase [Gemmatimonadaceae bacterium]